MGRLAFVTMFFTLGIALVISLAVTIGVVLRRRSDRAEDAGSVGAGGDEDPTRER